MARQTQTVKITIKKPKGGGTGGRNIAFNTRRRGRGATRRKKKA